MSLERELKRALRAQDPGEAFTARVLERIKQERAGTGPAKLEGAKADAEADVDADAEPDTTSIGGAQPRAPRSGQVQTEGGVHDSRPAPGVPLPQNVARFETRQTRDMHTHTRRPRLAWFAAMAATLALTVGGAQWVKHRQEIAEGERARAEVLTALRLTSAKLSIVRATLADADAPREETAH
jgi:hypothetical protein